jgi:hypothetical protein
MILHVLGALPDGASIAPFSDVTRDPHAPADAIAVFSPVENALEIDTILTQMKRPLAPIADFSGTNNFRRDIQVPERTAVAIASTLSALHDLVENSREPTFLPDSSDRIGLAFLGIAHTRKQPLKAAWRPNHANALWYPLIGGGLSGRRVLENLANAGLFRRRFAQRLHVCGDCQSHRLQVFEACTECASGFLDEESIVHHFACGEQGPESQFLAGHDLICPKCNQELRHFGVDYARPGQVLLCKSCKAVMSEPFVRFVCTDCGVSVLAEQLETRDWFDYEISEEGADAFLRQRLPAVTFDDLLQPHERAFGRREFRLLAIEAARLANRYERPMTLVQIALPNGGDGRQDIGKAAADETNSLIIDLLVEQLRETDFFTNSAEYELLAVLPETMAEQARTVFDRFTTRVHEVVADRPHLQIEIIDPKDAMTIIEGVA